MSTIKILSGTEEDKKNLKSMFDFDKRLNKYHHNNLENDDEKINTWVENNINYIQNKTSIVSMQFDQNGVPLNMISGFIIPEVSGWFLGTVKIRIPTNHFYQSAQIIAPANDFLINTMENMGLYKFWVVGPDKQLENRWRIMRQVSKTFRRYVTHDEMIIKKGHKSPSSTIEKFRKVNDNSDEVVKLLTLNNYERRRLLGLNANT